MGSSARTAAPLPDASSASGCPRPGSERSTPITAPATSPRAASAAGVRGRQLRSLAGPRHICAGSNRNAAMGPLARSRRLRRASGGGSRDLCDSNDAKIQHHRACAVKVVPPGASGTSPEPPDRRRSWLRSKASPRSRTRLVAGSGARVVSWMIVVGALLGAPHPPMVRILHEMSSVSRQDGRLACRGRSLYLPRLARLVIARSRPFMFRAPLAARGVHAAVPLRKHLFAPRGRWRSARSRGRSLSCGRRGPMDGGSVWRLSGVFGPRSPLRAAVVPRRSAARAGATPTLPRARKKKRTAKTPDDASRWVAGGEATSPERVGGESESAARSRPQTSLGDGVVKPGGLRIEWAPLLRRVD
jgi:hypothetical protein